MAEIPKIVRQRLRTAEGAGVHPDGNLMAAFVERSLANRERLEVLEHLSRCAGCREIVALSAAPPEAVSASGVLPAAAPWFSWPVLRWGAALACVVVVGAAVTLRHRHESPTLTGGKFATEARVQDPKSSFANLETKNAVVYEQPGQPRPAVPSSPAAPPAKRLDVVAANPASAQLPVEMADARTGAPLADVPGRAKVPSPESQELQPERAIPGAFKKQRNMVEAANAGSVTADAFVSTNLTPRWTLSSDGTLQRSLDSGRSWQTIPVSGKTIFQALAADGLEIWVGGSAGALFHSSDAGQRWIQVRPVANGEELGDDIIGVEFADPLHGKLTTSNAETWTTADAGQTWHRN